MRHFITRLVIACLLALTLGYGVARASRSMNCYMEACGCKWTATNCEYCNFYYEGGECYTFRTNCEAFYFNCNQ